MSLHFCGKAKSPRDPKLSRNKSEYKPKAAGANVSRVIDGIFGFRSLYLYCGVLNLFISPFVLALKSTIQRSFFMKKKGLIITLSVILVAIIAVFGVLLATNKLDFQKGDKNITVTVVYENKIEKEFKILTGAKNLGDALLEKGLVTKEEHKTGYYQSIDSIRADYTLDKAWWCFTKDGEEITVGANELPIADGDSFEITHTPA